MVTRRMRTKDRRTKRRGTKRRVKRKHTRKLIRGGDLDKAIQNQCKSYIYDDLRANPDDPTFDFNEIQKYISKNEDNYTDFWIVIAHPDEFYLEDFDFIISKAYYKRRIRSSF